MEKKTSKSRQRKKWRWTAGCGLGVVAGLIGGLYAKSQTSVTNYIETGIVDIQLQEYQLQEGKEVLWQGTPIVLPGMEISKIPRITNHGNDCYIRAKLTFTGTYQNAELEEGIYGQSNQWVHAQDGYYYYREVLASTKCVDLFEGIKIPEDFPQEEGKNFGLQIDVDAVQSANFQPDYSQVSPWGDVEILDCGKEGLYDLTLLKQADQAEFAVVYEGETSRLFTNGIDFFHNFPALLPGDTYTDTALLQNISDKPVKLYFHTEQMEDSSLLDKLQLTISFSGKEKRQIYQGSLCGTEISQEFLLTTIPAGESRELVFTLEVPAELNNEYSISKALVKWVFAADQESIYGTRRVKTGDQGNVIAIFLGAAAAAALTGLAAAKGLRRRKEKGR